MKRITTLLFFTIITTQYACRKEDKHCWECLTSLTTSSLTDTITVVTDTTAICDYSFEEKLQYEAKGYLKNEIDGITYERKINCLIKQ